MEFERNGVKMSIKEFILGKWDGKPIEWSVLKEESFGTLVISKDRIAQMVFDSSSNNNWGSCSLRKFLNGVFFNQAFSDDEKKKIVNVKFDNTKDDIFILTKDEVENLLKDDCYNTEYHGSCSYCCWTRTKDGTKVRKGYASGCWCSYAPNYGKYSVRPAMYIKMK